MGKGWKGPRWVISQVHPGVTEMVKGLLSLAQSFLVLEQWQGTGWAQHGWVLGSIRSQLCQRDHLLRAQHSHKTPQQCTGWLGKQGQLLVKSLFWCHSGVPKWMESTEGINTEQATETMKSAPPPAPQLSPAEPSEV